MFKNLLNPKYIRQYATPMGGSIGKNVLLPKRPKWDDAAWDKEKKKNEKVYSSDIRKGKRTKKKNPKETTSN